MTEPTDAPGTVGVTDHRVPPRGVLPRHLQTWLMAATRRWHPARHPAGRAAGATDGTHGRLPPRRRRPTRTACGTIRTGSERSRPRRCATFRRRSRQDVPTPAMYYDEPTQAPPEDPLEADRRRREYESLFASNVAVSRRPDNERPGGQAARRQHPLVIRGLPSVDEVVDVGHACDRPEPARRRTPPQPASQAVPPPAPTGCGCRRTGHACLHRADRRVGPAAPPARRHADRHGADQPPRREQRRAGESAGDEPDLHAQRPSGRHPGGRTNSGRDTARAIAWRDRASPWRCTGWSCPMAARTVSTSSWA